MIRVGHVLAGFNRGWDDSCDFVFTVDWDLQAFFDQRYDVPDKECFVPMIWWSRRRKSCVDM